MIKKEFSYCNDAERMKLTKNSTHSVFPAGTLKLTYNKS